MMAFAELAVERVLNSLPEGILLALGAWLLLRLIGRQNSGTRFAVWLVTLLGVLVLPLVGGLGASRSALLHGHAEVTVSPLWATGFLVLWIPIAAIALARVAAGVWQVRRIRQSCSPVNLTELDQALQQVLRQTKRPVRLLVSDQVRVPAAIGFRNPAIVLPAWSLSEMTPEELRPILIHELAHLERHDDWTNLLQKSVRALFFFHPAVWWIDSRLSLEREMACDDAVLAATGNPRAYAGCLIGLLERSCARRGWTMAQAAVARAREASLRIARILHVGSAATTHIARPVLGLAAGLSVACSGVLLCTPRLLVFAPAPSGSIAAVSAEPVLDHGVTFPAAAMVPAAYHPPQNVAPAEHEPAAHPARTRKAPSRVETATRKPAPPVVLASLPRRHAEPAAVPAMVLVVETASFSDGSGMMPQAPAPTQAVVKQPAPQPSGEVQAVQVRTLQYIESDATGIHVQMIRVVFFVPAHNVNPSASIAQTI